MYPNNHNGRMPQPGHVPRPLVEACEVAGDRWVLLTLAALSGGARRFGDLIGDLAGIAPNVLTERLRRMERHGIVSANLYSERPRRYVYDLTESGRELAGVLPALAAWAGGRSGGEPLRHDVCGSPLSTRVWCETCDRVVEPTEHADITRTPTPDELDGTDDTHAGSGLPDTTVRWV